MQGYGYSVPPQGPPPIAFTCPRCGAHANPAPGPQTCAACRGAFALYPGAGIDRAVMPLFDPRLPHLTVRGGGGFEQVLGTIDAEGIREMKLDPVIGASIESNRGIRFAEIQTIAIWRKVDVVMLVVALVIAPASLFSLVLAFWETMFVVPFVLLAPFAIWGVVASVFLRKHLVRVVGMNGVLELRFDRPTGMRKGFHDELLRRAGLPPSVIP